MEAIITVEILAAASDHQQEQKKRVLEKKH
jgi:hypothetical protein